jgi:TetR/AcrR family transcriptional regulator, regulator of cefoperazone and chloramphenicol sensitivity
MLNMRSTPADDLTTVARIRDAAIGLFGRDGFAATSVRAVATAAGVSPALVLHHFGSKDGLRAACDEHIVARVMGRKGALGDGQASVRAMQGWLADVEQFRPELDYLARMLTEGSSAADELFDRLFAGTAAMFRDQVADGIMRESDDPELLAAYVTAYGLAPLLLRRHLARTLGSDGFDEGLIRRSTLPILELYTHGIYLDDRFLVAAREALARTSGPSSGKGDNDPHQDPDPPRGSAS